MSIYFLANWSFRIFIICSFYFISSCVETKRVDQIKQASKFKILNKSSFELCNGIKGEIEVLSDTIFC